MPTMTTSARIYNFSAGPAVLPLPVLEEAQRDLLTLPGVGMSVLEISHRSPAFDEIIQGAEADFRALAASPRATTCCSCRAAPALQFSMVPMNLLPPAAPPTTSSPASWSKKAVKEAKKVGTRQHRRDHGGGELHAHPAQDELTLDAGRGLRPLHLEQHDLRHRVAAGPRSAACRWSATPRPTSSARPSTSRSYGLIYAGAQKNLGPSGVTLVIVREDLLARPAEVAADDAPLRDARRERLALQHAAGLRHLHARPGAEVAPGAGGLAAMAGATSARRRSSTPRSTGPASTAATRPGEPVADERHLPAAVARSSRSSSSKSDRRRLDGLKGHRSVGGLRASIYNAFPEEGVDALVAFMREFEKRTGEGWASAPTLHLQQSETRRTGAADRGCRWR